MSPAPFPRRPAGPRAIVIGAGAIGLFCALAIAQDGGEVTVVDADAAWSPSLAPRGASHAAAGMLGAFAEALHEGPGHHRRLGALCSDGLAAWRKLAGADPALARLVRFPGVTLLAHDDADAARVRRAVDRAQAQGVDAVYCDGLASGLDARVFGPVIASARIPDEGLVSPTAMLTALAARLAALGGSILRGRTAAEIVVSAGEVRGVEFEGGGGLNADIVVIATGALAPTALKAFAPALRKVKPAKGALGVTQLHAATATPEIVRSPRLYFLRDGAELRFGATMQPGRTDLDEDPDAIAALFDVLKQMLPGAPLPLTARHLGVGLRPMSPDGAPLVGPHGPAGCFAAIGHGRNGWLLAPLTGAAIADMVRGAETDPMWAAFHPDRFG